MGFFDDFAHFAGEVNSMKKEFSQFGSDLLKEVASETTDVKQIVTVVTDDIAAAASDISATVHQSSVSTVPEDKSPASD